MSLHQIVPSILTVTATFSSFDHVGYLVPLLVLHLSVPKQIANTAKIFQLDGICMLAEWFIIFCCWGFPVAGDG